MAQRRRPGSGNHWSTKAVYVVYDNGTPLYVDSSYDDFTTVDQTSPPGNDSPIAGDRQWLLLGVWNVAAGHTITVGLFNNDDSPNTVLCAGDAMIHAIWPTVSIRSTNVTANPNVPSAYAGDYTDWVDASNPPSIPVEGSGSRLGLQVTALIELLYYSILGSTLSDWTAVLPNVDGLDFWSSATTTTSITPDGSGDIIDSVLGSGGSGPFAGSYEGYVGTVFASIDSTSTLATNASSGLSSLVSIVAEAVNAAITAKAVAKVAVAAPKWVYIPDAAKLNVSLGPEDNKTNLFDASFSMSMQPDQAVFTKNGINPATAVCKFIQIVYNDINTTTLGGGFLWSIWPTNPPLGKWFVNADTPPYYPHTTGGTALLRNPFPGMDDRPGPQWGLWALQNYSFKVETCAVCTVGATTYVLGDVQWGFSYTVQGPSWNRTTVGEKLYVNKVVWDDAGQKTITVIDINTGQPKKITIGGPKLGTYSARVNSIKPSAEMAKVLSKYF